MATCPFATFAPVVNHGGPMAGVKGLVLHVQVGNGSLYGYFNNPSSQVSAHFWCAKDGRLEQYVDTNTQAWAEAGGNPYYLSVETEGLPSESLTAQQITTLSQLLAWSSRVHSFPVVGPVAHGQPGFTPHCNPDGSPDPAWGNHPCPGGIRLAQMPAIVQAAQGQSPPQPQPPTPKEYIEMGDSVFIPPNVAHPAGQVVSHAVGASGTAIAGHLLELTRDAAKLGGPATEGLSVIDITAAFPQFEVAP